jgi:hypothetical protein
VSNPDRTNSIPWEPLRGLVQAVPKASFRQVSYVLCPDENHMVIVDEYFRQRFPMRGVGNVLRLSENSMKDSHLVGGPI